MTAPGTSCSGRGVDCGGKTTFQKKTLMESPVGAHKANVVLQRELNQPESSRKVDGRASDHRGFQGWLVKGETHELGLGGYARPSWEERWVMRKKERKDTGAGVGGKGRMPSPGQQDTQRKRPGHRE